MRETTACEAPLADLDVTARPATDLVDAALVTVADGLLNASVCRFVAFSSRTAASAIPMQTEHNIPIKDRTFFISS